MKKNAGKEIVQIGAPILRQKALPVAPEEFGGKALKDILRAMEKALNATEDGAALAAPQIGVSKRIFILSSRVFGPEGEHGSKNLPLIYINPRIVRHARKRELMDEGCLSVRGKYGTIKRARGVTLEAYDEEGNKFTRGAGGLLAQVFQHECDHLDGVLFVDRAEEVWRIPPSEEHHSAQSP